MRKAQMEVLGLMVVVLLLSIAVLFVVTFVFLDETRDPSQQHQESQLSSNLLNAMLQTTAMDCGKQQLKSLFRDCALTNEIRCDNGKRSCQYLNETVFNILEGILNTPQYRRAYFFNATGIPQTNIEGGIQFGRPCQGDLDAKQFPIQAQRKTVEIQIELCG
ncbi:hypothetical protein H6504_03470 [Candidatus Woesearchaeota archaeon]|nr:hypothetical protein [Candidatus Woesearchaeota archaeon]